MVIDKAQRLKMLSACVRKLGSWWAEHNVVYVCAAQVRYCLHAQQRLLKEQWPIKLAEHHMARTVSIGDLEGNGPGGQVLFNGLRVRMAINTGSAPSSATPQVSWD